MKNKLSHIGIAVDNLQGAVDIFTNVLDKKPDATEEISGQKVRAAFFTVGESRVEFLEGISPDSAITKFVKKRGNGIHHLCFEVDDIKSELSRLKESGFTFIDEEPRMGAEGKMIAFIHPKSTAGILIELSQKISD